MELGQHDGNTGGSCGVNSCMIGGSRQRQTRKRRPQFKLRRGTHKIKYWPRKYYSGLTYKQKKQRYEEIKKFGKMHWRNPKAYVGFKSDKYAKTRKSSYSLDWQRLFPNAKSLEERADATGVPLKYIRESYNRGVAAWRTGHRPGATAQQWGYARAASFLLCGKTHYTTDSDLVRKAKHDSAAARKWWQSRKCVSTHTTA